MRDQKESELKRMSRLNSRLLYQDEMPFNLSVDLTCKQLPCLSHLGIPLFLTTSSLVQVIYLSLRHFEFIVYYDFFDKSRQR